jgi:hypothetical protein
MGAKPPKNEPPHWLQVGDENWGPTNLRKHKAPPLSAPPPLPAVWEIGVQPHRSGWWWLRGVATILALVPGENERFYTQLLRGLATWGVILIAIAAVVDWLK